MKNILITTNKLIDLGNLNALILKTSDYLKRKEKEKYLDDVKWEQKESHEGNSLIIDFTFKRKDEKYRCQIRDIPIDGLNDMETTKRIKSVIKDFAPDKLFIHLSSFGRAKIYDDFLSIRVVRDLYDTKQRESVIFFSTAPIDSRKFKQDTEFRIITESKDDETLVDKIFDCIFDENTIALETRR